MALSSSTLPVDRVCRGVVRKIDIATFHAACRSFWQRIVYLKEEKEVKKASDIGSILTAEKPSPDGGMVRF